MYVHRVGHYAMQLMEIFMASTIGERIRTLRLLHGLTQEKLARELGVTLGQVSNWEREQDEPKIKSLRAICQFFHVSYGVLIDGAEVVNPHSELPLGTRHPDDRADATGR